MKEFILSITPQEWITFAGIALTAVSSIVATIIGKNSKKSTDTQNTTLTSIFGGIVETLNGVKQTSDEAKLITDENSKKLGDTIQYLTQNLLDNKNQNLAVAAFVLECFKQSNLSDEKKANLQLQFDQLFYQDRGELITALQAERSQAQAELKAEIETNNALRAELENTKLQLQNATSVKKSRRL